MPISDEKTRQGIDQINANISQIDSDDPFARVSEILIGQTTAREQRTVTVDICDTVLPGNSQVSAGNPSLVVTLGPNSYDAGGNAASNPLIQTIGVAYQALIQANPKRQRIIIQNNGTTNLFIIFGNATSFSATSSALYHIKIPAGQTYIDEQWIGRIDIVSDNAGGIVSAVETWKNLNVSQ